MKKQKKIKQPMDISNGTRMNWLMKKTGYKKSRETVPLKDPWEICQKFLHCTDFSIKGGIYDRGHLGTAEKYPKPWPLKGLSHEI